MLRFNSILIFSFFWLGWPQLLHAQLEKVIVEKYYVSDANDATDTWGGGVPVGSTTYRIYVDLAPGTVLKKIYGDVGHPFSIASTSSFFNNALDGQSFAKDFIKNRYLENTVALDTWLTLGQTARKQGDLAYFGILKQQDSNGSFIGGINNDGGSESIPTGLLINEDPSAGSPLTISDGMDTSSVTPTNWFSNGILDFLSGNDTTIFGSLIQGDHFYSDNFILSCSGVMGIVADSNQILIAQLTTTGELSFTINLEVEYIIDGIPTTISYVGTNSLTSGSVLFHPFLSYPFACGCNDPNFLQYDPSVVCLEPGSCIDPIVLGCMDTLACNYDPLANQNISDLCCYPGWCNNRNIEEVCPQLKGNSFDINVYPNPTSGNITLSVINGVISPMNYYLTNSYGVVVRSRFISDAPFNYSEEMNISDLPTGIYQMRVTTNSGEKHQLFIKL